MTAAIPEAASARLPRDGNSIKRAAILDAARDLFVQDSVDRTSMDAIAARAGVSKRTVYDYYGDKHGLLRGVITASGETLIEALKAALDAHLSDAADIPDVMSLERAMTAFAAEVGSSMIATAHYAATVRLVSENSAQAAELEHHPLADASEVALAERIAHFARRGLLDAPDPRTAADHFTGLTTLLASNLPPSSRADPDRIRQTMTAGARAFMRAYGARDR